MKCPYSDLDKPVTFASAKASCPFIKADPLPFMEDLSESDLNVFQGAPEKYAILISRIMLKTGTKMSITFAYKTLYKYYFDDGALSDFGQDICIDPHIPNAPFETRDELIHWFSGLLRHFQKLVAFYEEACRVRNAKHPVMQGYSRAPEAMRSAAEWGIQESAAIPMFFGASAVLRSKQLPSSSDFWEHLNGPIKRYFYEQSHTNAYNAPVYLKTEGPSPCINNREWLGVTAAWEKRRDLIVSYNPATDTIENQMSNGEFQGHVASDWESTYRWCGAKWMKGVQKNTIFEDVFHTLSEVAQVYYAELERRGLLPKE